MKSKPKILIIRLSSIGDILLTTPFVRQTRIAYPEAQIDYVIKKRFVDLIRFNPHLNNIITFDESTGFKGLLLLKEKIKRQKYDYILDLHNNLRSRIITSFLPAQIFRIKKNKIKRALLVYTKINLFKQVLPIPQKYLNVGKHLNIKDDHVGLELFWKDDIEKSLYQKINENFLNEEYIAIAPGAGFKTKQWPIEYFRTLIKMLSANHPFKMVILGSKEEREQFRPLEISEKVINFAGKLTLLESAIILSRARYLVSNDSGLMHMAAAVNTPVLAIFGSTVKEFGFFPFRAKSRVLEVERLWCRPCSHVGRKHCPLGHLKCLKLITPSMVFESLKSWN